MKTLFCAMLMILIAVFMLLNYFLLQLPAILKMINLKKNHNCR